MDIFYHKMIYRILVNTAGQIMDMSHILTGEMMNPKDLKEEVV